jgi:hypothetical protein
MMLLEFQFYEKLMARFLGKNAFFICLHQGKLSRHLGILRNVNKDASGM